MFKILSKELLAPNIYRMDIEAPRVAQSAKPGQFIILLSLIHISEPTRPY